MFSTNRLMKAMLTCLGKPRARCLACGLALFSITNAISAGDLIDSVPEDTSARFERILKERGVEATEESLINVASGDEDLLRRLLAIDLLGLKEVTSARDLLAQIVSKDEDRYVREVAALALARIGDPRGIPALLGFLESSDKDDRRISLSARLAELQVADGYIHVIHGLDSTDESLRSESLKALDPFIENRHRMGLGDDPIDRLILLSEDPSARLRRESIIRMWNAVSNGVPARRFLPRLKAMAKDDVSSDVRQLADAMLFGWEFWGYL